jgi:hypothetical protein
VNAVARAIIRYSASTGTAGNRMRKEVRTAIKRAGFSERRGTGAWELETKSPANLGVTLAEISAVIVKAAPDTLDHLWVYIDNPD